MTDTSRSLQRVACAVGLLFCTLFATPSWAGIIYEFREEGSSTVIGRLDIDTPPASSTSGWSTSNPTHLLALTLADSVFGLGPGNLLPGATITAANVLSLDGSNLDVGNVDITLPTILTGNPLDPAIDRFLALIFDVAAGSDFIGLQIVSTLTFDDEFRFGTWTAPEPATAALLVIGLAAAGRAIRRRRR